MAFIDTSGLSGEALFEAIQANFEAEEKAAAGSSGGSTSSFKSNKLRSSIFDTVAGAMQPDRRQVARYEELIRISYINNAKKELNRSKRGYVTRTNRPTYQGVGWALGNKPGGLYKEFGADVFVNITKPKKGTMDITYEVQPDFKRVPWGEGLAEDRSPSIVSRNHILGWIWQKQKNGHFKIGSKKMSNIRQNSSSSDIKGKIASVINGIAIAIQKKMANDSRPPVMKDWYRLDRNKRLELNFRKDVDRKGAYYRTQIRKSIIKNINAQK
jgi:hypothetical protein